MQYAVQRCKRENSVKNLYGKDEMLIVNSEQNINCKVTAWNDLIYTDKCINSPGSEAHPDKGTSKAW